MYQDRTHVIWQSTNHDLSNQKPSVNNSAKALLLSVAHSQVLSLSNKQC